MGALVAAGIVVIASAVAGGAAADGTGAGATAARPVVPTHRHAAGPPRPGPSPLNTAPITPGCPEFGYTIAVNGTRLPDRDEPMRVTSGQRLVVAISPTSGQRAITAGSATLTPLLRPGSSLTAADTSSTVTGTTTAAGGLTVRLRVAFPTGVPLPAGRYTLVAPYDSPCPAAAVAGGELDISVLVRR